MLYAAVYSANVKQKSNKEFSEFKLLGTTWIIITKYYFFLSCQVSTIIWKFTGTLIKYLLGTVLFPKRVYNPAEKIRRTYVKHLAHIREKQYCKKREVAMASEVLFSKGKDACGTTEGGMSTAGTPAGQALIHSSTNGFQLSSVFQTSYPLLSSSRKQVTTVPSPLEQLPALVSSVFPMHSPHHGSIELCFLCQTNGLGTTLFLLQWKLTLAVIPLQVNIKS